MEINIGMYCICETNSKMLIFTDIVLLVNKELLTYMNNFYSINRNYFSYISLQSSIIISYIEIILI